MSALITEVDTASVNRWWETSTPSTYLLTIESSTGGSTDPPAETYTQNAETTLAVTAYPDNGYTLNHWLLDGVNVGSRNPLTVAFNSNHVLQPVFTQSGLPAFSPLSVAGVAGVVIALIAVTIALRGRRRKPSASSPGEPVKPEAKPTTPPEAVELEMSTRKKFVFCPECGEKLPNLNAKFCPFCGARLGLQP
jgi:hypothetical protein